MKCRCVFPSNTMRRGLSAALRFLPSALEERIAGALPAAVETTIPVSSSSSTRLINLILCRDATTRRVKAFENFCPHQAGRLFLAPDGLLQCRLHGARFEISDGRCVSGPCSGSRLSMLSVDEDEHGQISTTLAALSKLASAGSGGTVPKKTWRPSAKAQEVLDAFAEAQAGGRV